MDYDKKTEKPIERTRERLAKEFSVSPRTIMRDREYSEGIDRLEPELRHEVLRGSQKLPKEVVREVGRVVSPEAARLSLPQVMALIPLDIKASKIKDQESSTVEAKNLIGQIKKLASQLDLDLSTFKEQCDDLIGLLLEVKKHS